MRQRRLMNQINVVPYIDVMLVLLVIFMVAAPMMQTASVDLPSVGRAATPPVAPMEVVVRPDATLSLRDPVRGSERGVDRQELAQLVREAQTRNPEQAVVISADKNVRYEAVMRVMDELQRQQVKKIGLLVQPQGK